MPIFPGNCFCPFCAAVFLQLFGWVLLCWIMPTINTRRVTIYPSPCLIALALLLVCRECCIFRLHYPILHVSSKSAILERLRIPSRSCAFRWSKKLLDIQGEPRIVTSEPADGLGLLQAVIELQSHYMVVAVTGIPHTGAGPIHASAPCGSAAPCHVYGHCSCSAGVGRGGQDGQRALHWAQDTQIHDVLHRQQGRWRSAGQPLLAPGW